MWIPVCTFNCGILCCVPLFSFCCGSSESTFNCWFLFSITSFSFHCGSLDYMHKPDEYFLSLLHLHIYVHGGTLTQVQYPLRISVRTLSCGSLFLRSSFSFNCWSVFCISLFSFRCDCLEDNHEPSLLPSVSCFTYQISINQIFPQ